MSGSRVAVCIKLQIPVDSICCAACSVCCCIILVITIQYCGLYMPCLEAVLSFAYTTELHVIISVATNRHMD
jgi:hypothetical protein